MKLPPYDVYPALISDKIVLRQIAFADIKDIVEISFYDGKPASNEQEALEMLRKIEQDYKNGDSVHWGIADPTTDTIVGTCGFYRGFANDAGELGCVLRSAFRGKGYMTAAIALAIDFGINGIGLEKIIAITSKENDKAIQLLSRLKFSLVSDSTEEKILYALNR